MFGLDSKHASRIDILIGKSARIQGDIDFTGGLHVDGRINGNVRAEDAAASTLSVSESGCIEGSVEVPNVELDGTITGDIHARQRVVLGASAKVHGDVYYGMIETALGAQISGKLVPLAAAPAVDTAAEQAKPSTKEGSL
jgi:cytoskeletal protein CcmA (bactofilin family)